MKPRINILTREKSRYSEEHKITELRLYSNNAETFYFEFRPVYVSENVDIKSKDFDTYDSLRIYCVDWEKLVSPLIEALYPLKCCDPYFGRVQKEFDLTGENYLCAEDMRRLKDMLEENSRNASPEEQGFYDEVLKYAAWAETVSGLFCITCNMKELYGT